jgi:DNA-binding GntR family transcriptional regulator
MDTTDSTGTIVGPATKHELAYSQIRARILDRSYGPGYRLVLSSLARDLGLSTVTVREAIRRLEAEGWVIFIPNVGAQVKPFDLSEWAGMMDVLAVLSGHATALASLNLREEDLRQLRTINASMSRSLEKLDILEFLRMNREFHFAIYARAGNAYLLRQLTDAWERTEMLRQSPFTYRAKSAAPEHERLLEMIEAKDHPEDIEREAREHHSRAVKALGEKLAQAEPVVGISRS